MSSKTLESPSFGEELYRLRTERSLTQARIADLASIDRGYYSQLENGRKRAPPARTLQRIANALDLTERQKQGLYSAAAAERLRLKALKGADCSAGRLLLVRDSVLLTVTASKLRRIEKILSEK